MSRFVDKGETKTIHADWWDDDEEVIIKRFTWGDKQKLAGMAVNIGLVDGAPLTEFQLGQMNMAIMEAGIKSWTLKGPEDRIVPLTSKWIYQLEERDGNFILQAINSFNRRRSAEEQANFRGTDRDGSAEQ